MKKIKMILGLVILILFLFTLLVISFKYFWPEEWSGAAQATLAAAIIASIVSILGTYLKFIFDQMSSETKYNQKISEKMISKVHTYAEKYYIPLGIWARLSASQLDMIITKEASTEEKQQALCSITKYFQYILKLNIESGGMILFRNFDSELRLEHLNVVATKSLGLTINQICRLLKYTSLDDTPLDFSIKIQDDGELMKIYKEFEEWLDNISSVKETIAYFHCYNKLMFHELNSIYMPWYGKKAPQIPHKCEKVFQTFKYLEKLELKKDKGKISKSEYKERKEEGEEDLNKFILEFF